MLRRIAALDLGSNSFHLAIFDIVDRKRFALVARRKEKVQMGQSVFRTGSIEREAFERGTAALTRLSAYLEECGADAVIAVATSAFREADNTAEFLACAERLTGVCVTVIDGAEEARLVGLGSASSDEPGRQAIFDLGGGSLEAAVMDRDRCALNLSLPVGTLRSRPREGALATAADVASLREQLSASIAPALERVARLRPRRIVLSCGAARDLCRMGAGAVRDAAGGSLTRETLEAVQTALLEGNSTVDGSAVDSDERARLLVATCVFHSILQHFDAPRAYVAEGGLRHGLIVDYLRCCTPLALRSDERAVAAS